MLYLLKNKPKQKKLKCLQKKEENQPVNKKDENEFDLYCCILYIIFFVNDKSSYNSKRGATKTWKYYKQKIYSTSKVNTKNIISI